MNDQENDGISSEDNPPAANDHHFDSEAFRNSSEVSNIDLDCNTSLLKENTEPELLAREALESNILDQSSRNQLFQNNQTSNLLPQEDDSARNNLLPQLESVGSQEMESTLGIKTVLSSTLSESLLDQGLPQKSFEINESVISANISMADIGTDLNMLVDSMNDEKTVSTPKNSLNDLPSSSLFSSESVNIVLDNICNPLPLQESKITHIEDPCEELILNQSNRLVKDPSRVINASNKLNVDQDSQNCETRKINTSEFDSIGNLCESVNDVVSNTSSLESVRLPQSESSESNFNSSMGTNEVFKTNKVVLNTSRQDAGCNSNFDNAGVCVILHQSQESVPEVDSSLKVGNLFKSVSDTTCNKSSMDESFPNQSVKETSDFDSSVGTYNLFKSVNESNLNLSLNNLSRSVTESSMGLNDLFYPDSIQTIHPLEKLNAQEQISITRIPTDQVSCVVSISDDASSNPMNADGFEEINNFDKPISQNDSLNISSHNSTLGFNKLNVSMNADRTMTENCMLSSSSSTSSCELDEISKGYHQEEMVSANYGLSSITDDQEIFEKFKKSPNSAFDNTGCSSFDYSLEAVLNFSLYSAPMNEQDLTETENTSADLPSVSEISSTTVDVISINKMKNVSEIDSSLDGSDGLHTTENYDNVTSKNCELVLTDFENEEGKENILLKENTMLKKSVTRNETGDMTCNSTKYFSKDVDITSCVNVEENTAQVSFQMSTEDKCQFTQSHEIKPLDIYNNPDGSDDMDETLVTHHIQEFKRTTPNRNLANDGYSGTRVNTSKMEITTRNPSPNHDSISLKPLSPEKQMSGNMPETTILGEETIVMSQSVYGIQESEILPESISILKNNASIKIPRYLSPAPERLLKKARLSDESDDETVQSSASLDETGMCTMDYSLPLSDCTGMVSQSSVFFDNKAKKEDYSIASINLGALRKLSLTLDEERPSGPEVPKNLAGDISVSLECSNNSGLMWDSYLPSDCNKSSLLNKSVNVASDIRKLLSESINNSIFTQQEHLSNEEMVSIKCNLDILINLLKKEYDEFDNYKKITEKEKLKMLEKIEFLENQTHSSTEAFKKLQIISEENIKQNQKDLNTLKEPFTLTETDLPQFNVLLTKLDSLDISTAGIIVGETEKTVNLEALLSILSSLLTKYNTFLEKHNETLKTCKENQKKLENLDTLSKKYAVKKEEIIILKEKCAELQNALKKNESLVTNLQNKLLNSHDVKKCKEEYDAKVKIDNENLAKLQEELMLSKEKFTEVLLKHEKVSRELIVEKKNIDSLEIENDIILNSFIKNKEEMEALEKIKIKYLSLENEYALLTQKFENSEANVGEKIKHCEDISLINENLQKQVENFNLLLEERKKIPEEENMHLKEEYNILKSQFDEQCLLLEKNIADINLLKNANVAIMKDLDIAKKAFDSENNSNIILKSEFKALLLQFEEINAKYKILLKAKDALGKNYGIALEQIEILKKDYECEVGTNKKNSEEISTLKDRLSEVSLRFSDLQSKFNKISSENDSYSSQLVSLTAEIQKLTLRYTATLSEFKNLQESLFEKTELNKLLENKVESLNKNIIEVEQSLSELKNNYDATVSMYEFGLFKINQLENDNVLLEQKYGETLKTLKELKSVSSEREESNKKNLRKINCHIDEINHLKDDLSISSKNFEVLLQKYESESLKVKYLEEELSQLQQKYQESCGFISKLETDCLEKDTVKVKLINEVSDLTLQLNEINTKFSKLTSDYSACALNLENEQSKLISLQKDNTCLNDEYKKVVSKLEIMDAELSNVIKINDEKSLEVEDLNKKIFKLNEDFTNLKNEHLNVLLKFDSETAKLNSSQTDFSHLEQKFQESISKTRVLEEDLIEKEALKEKLLGDLKHITNEFSNLQQSYDLLSGKYRELSTIHDSKCSDLSSLMSNKKELEAKYEEAISTILKLQEECASKFETYQNITQEIEAVRSELVSEKNTVLMLKNDYDQALSVSSEKQMKLTELKCDYNNLKSKFEESIIKINSLEAENADKLKDNIKLNGEISNIQFELQQISDHMTSMKEEYGNLKRNNECQSIKFNELQGFCDELTEKYEECLKWVRTFNKLSSGDNHENVDSEFDSPEPLNFLTVDDKHELHKTKYNEAFFNVKHIISQSLSKIEINEKLVNEIEGLRSELLAEKDNLLTLKNDYDKVLSVSNDKQAKFIELEYDYNNLKSKFEEAINKINSLETEIADKSQNIIQLNEEINNLQFELQKMIEQMSELKEEHKILKLKSEEEDLKNVELKSFYDELLFKYEEGLKWIISLNKLSSENNDSVNGQHFEINSLIPNTLQNLNTKHEYFSSNYNEAILNIKKILADCISKSEINEKLCQEIEAVKSELLTEKDNVLNLKNNYEKAIFLSTEEQTKLNTLEFDYNTLKQKFEESTYKINSLEAEITYKSEKNIKLNEEKSSVQFELQNKTERISALNDELNTLKLEIDEERSKHINLKTIHDELLLKYKEGLKWIKELDKLSSGANDCATEHYFEIESFSSDNFLQTLNEKHEYYNNKYNELIFNIKQILDVSSNYKIANEKMEIDIKRFTDLLLTNESTLMGLKEEFESLKIKYREEIEKCELLQRRVLEQEIEFGGISSELAQLQKDLQLKISEFKLLEEENQELKNTNFELNSSIDLLKEDLHISKERSEEFAQECRTLNTELSNLSREKQLRKDFEKMSIDLQMKCHELEVDLAAKIRNESNNKSLQERLNHEKNSLESENRELINKISDLSEKVLDFSSEIDKFKLINCNLERDLERKHSEFNSIVLKIETYKHYEELIENLLSDYNCIKDKLLKNDNLSSEGETLGVFISYFECLLKEYEQVSTECIEKDQKLSKSKEEMSALQGELKSFSENAAQLEHKWKSLTESKAILEEQYTLLSSAHDVMKEKYESLSEQCNSLVSENDNLKELLDNHSKLIEEKDKKIGDLLQVEIKYGTLSVENCTNLSKLVEKCEEYKKIEFELSEKNKEFNELKAQLQNYLQEIDILKINNVNLKDQFDKLKAMEEKFNELEVENKKLKLDKVKYEKEYQTAIDSLRKTQDEMCNVEKKCDEKMSRFTFILKEKEDFENKTLSLLKQNDELSSKCKELVLKNCDYEKSYSKLLELESLHSILTNEKLALEKQLTDFNKYKRENTDLKANLAVKDSKLYEITNEMKRLKITYQQKTEQNQIMLDRVFSLIPGKTSFEEAVKGLESKLKTMEDELQEEKSKSTSLDEECEILNKDLQYKDKLLGDIYEEHSRELEVIKQSLKKSEETNKESALENASLKEKLQTLEGEITKLKNTKPSSCTDCMEVKQRLEKTLVESADRTKKVESLQKHMEEFKTSYKNKVLEYHKKISSLQKQLLTYEENKKSKTVVSAEAESQTDTEPLQLSTGPSGIVHLKKIKDLEDKVHKMEKENQTLKKICHNRLQTIKDLQAKVEVKSPADEPKKARNVLSEVQNN